MADIASPHSNGSSLPTEPSLRPPVEEIFPPDNEALAALRSLSTILGRLQFADRANLAFGGRRDYDKSLGYLCNLTISDYRGRYERGGVARRVVRAFPEATWGSGVAVVENLDPDTITDFEREFSLLMDRMAGWPRFMRADILAGLGRFGVLLIGAPGADMRTPLSSLAGQNDILYLQPYSEEFVQGIRFEDDPRNRRFGLPNTYTMQVGTPQFISGGTSQVTSTRTLVVHWSRLLHISDGLLDNDVYGEPRLRAVWNYLDDLLKIVGGGAEAAWKRADPGLWMDMDKDLMIDEKEEEAVEDEVQDYLHGLTRIMRTRGIKMQLLQSVVSGFASNAESVLQLIAAATGIPSRILQGSERGELASTQDRRNFSDRVAVRRKSFAEPLIREFIERLVENGALPRPSSFRVVWPDIEDLDEREKAEVAARLATANLRQSQASLPPIMTVDEIRDKILNLPPLPADASPSTEESDLDPRRGIDDPEDEEEATQFSNRDDVDAIRRAAKYYPLRFAKVLALSRDTEAYRVNAESREVA